MHCAWWTAHGRRGFAQIGSSERGPSGSPTAMATEPHGTPASTMELHPKLREGRLRLLEPRRRSECWPSSSKPI